MLEKVRNYLFLLIGIAIVAWSFVMVLDQPAPEKFQHTPVVKVGEKSIPVEIAETDATRSQGLSDRESLAANTGMLFIFENPGKYGFWMKDMKFPIDIVWIDEDWSVVGVHRGVKPENFPESYVPNSNIKYVLELNTGDAFALGIDTGTRLVFER